MSVIFPTVQNPVFVHDAFAKIAKRYVLTNHVLSFWTDILWRKKVARMVKTLSPHKLLDLATGSGDLAAEISRQCPSLEMVGADFCEPMLDQARARRVPGLTLLVVDAMDMPFAEASFDTVTVAFGLRNMASWSSAIREMARVLTPGGHLVILDFSIPSLPGIRKIYRFYLHNALPRIAGFLTGQIAAYKYLAGTIEKFPSGTAMNDFLQANGFASSRAIPFSLGIASVYIAQKPWAPAHQPENQIPPLVL